MVCAEPNNDCRSCKSNMSPAPTWLHLHRRNTRHPREHGRAILVRLVTHSDDELGPWSLLDSLLHTHIIVFADAGFEHVLKTPFGTFGDVVSVLYRDLGQLLLGSVFLSEPFVELVRVH